MRHPKENRKKKKKMWRADYCDHTAGLDHRRFSVQFLMVLYDTLLLCPAKQ
jgi:hypothetical protein